MNLGDVIITEARSAGVPVWLAFALADAESGIDPLCVSQNQNGTADLGLFQLNSRYLDEFSTRFNAGVPIDPFDPWTNARVALRLLATLHHVTKTWHGAVAAYNAGLGRWRTGQLPERTLAHIARVFSE
jgi:soluble lytic murein transglycosylase-like protein